MLEIKSGRWYIKAHPECGGNLSCLTWDGVDIMHPFSSVDQWREAPTNYGFAVLFPPNRIDGGRFTFNGRACQLPVNEPGRGNHLHGVALREQWKGRKVAANRIEMEYVFDRSSPMYSGYPFDCRLLVGYSVEEDELEQRFEVENLCAYPIPCALGFHTAFAIPEKVKVNGEGGRIELVPPRYLVSGREIGWNDGFEPSKWCNPADIWPFGHLRTGEAPLAELLYRQCKVSYMPDKKFGYWMVWRPVHDRTFLCIEPMNIKIGTFENEPEHLPVTEPGGKMIFTSKIKIDRI